MEDCKHCWTCQNSIIMNLSICGTLAAEHFKCKKWHLATVKNRCYRLLQIGISWVRFSRRKEPHLRFFFLVQLKSWVLFIKFVSIIFTQNSQLQILLKMGPNSKTFPVLVMPLMSYSSKLIILWDCGLKKNSISVANTNCSATKLKCLWSQQDKQKCHQP